MYPKEVNPFEEISHMFVGKVETMLKEFPDANGILELKMNTSKTKITANSIVIQEIITSDWKPDHVGLE